MVQVWVVELPQQAHISTTCWLVIYFGGAAVGGAAGNALFLSGIDGRVKRAWAKLDECPHTAFCTSTC